MPRVHLTHETLSVDALLAQVADARHGGTAVFLGTTRADSGADEVVALEYEAYATLASTEMRAIVAEAEAYGARVAVAHRLGRVAVGEASVIVAAAAAHRPQAFQACRYTIDELKRRVPIWKRAIRADGSTVWMDDVSAPVG